MPTRQHWSLSLALLALMVASGPAQTTPPDLEVLSGLSASHEVGWYPDDDLSVTALERFADLLPQVTQIAGAPPPTEILNLDIPSIVALTLENSADLAQARFSPRIQAHEVERQRGSTFDTTLTASYTFGETDTPTRTSGALVPSTRTSAFRTGLSQRLATGGLVDLSFSLTRTDTNSSLGASFSNSVGVGLTQPLLRGFGPTVTRAGITQAEIERQADEWDFRGTVISALAQAMNSHWDLFFTLHQAEVRLISLEQARVVLNNNRVRFRVGDMTRAEVLQAESVVAQREGDYLTALRNIQDAEDALWRIIDRSGDSPHWDRAIVPTDYPALEEMALSESQLLGIAMAMRPDLQAADLRLDSTEISRRVAANTLLPSLDFIGELGYSGIGGSANSAMDHTATFDFEDWVIGLSLEYPLQNRAARHGMRQAALRLAQAEVGIEALRLDIRLDVRNTLRRLQDAAYLLAAREAEVRARELELRDEQRRYEVGLSTTELLLRFQSDLASARINRISALVEYANALIALDEATGQLLEHHDVVIEPADTASRL